MEFRDSVAGVTLTRAKLLRAYEIVQARREEQLAARETFDFDTALIALLQRVPEDFTRQEVPAIVLRLQALNALLQTEDPTGWAQQDRANSALWRVNEALLHAAATAPLDLSRDEPAFEPGEFKRLALEAADPEGRA